MRRIQKGYCRRGCSRPKAAVRRGQRLGASIGIIIRPAQFRRQFPPLEKGSKEMAASPSLALEVDVCIRR
jgi:hypothetical protein